MLRQPHSKFTSQFETSLYSHRKHLNSLTPVEGNTSEELEPERGREREGLKGLQCVSSRECLILLLAIIRSMFLLEETHD